MAGWKLHNDGVLEPGAVVAPDERLGWGKMFGLGAQHVVAMFGATFLVPLITGFPIPATLFFSGVGTLLFLLITGNKLPSYLGSSFAFISPVLASKVGDDIGRALFGIMLAGILLAIVGAVVHLAGSAWIDALTVSYTHLDVYKRQAHTARSTRRKNRYRSTRRHSLRIVRSCSDTGIRAYRCT